jgi:hypothetical protein
VLEHHAVSVDVLERPLLTIPERVVRRDPLKPGRQHPSAAFLPFIVFGTVEDEQMVLGRRPADEVPALTGEFEMIGCRGCPSITRAP